jgi:hypothetical protein
MSMEEINQIAISLAKNSFEENNSMPLQMYFQSLGIDEIRALLNWTDDEALWKPKTYPDDRSQFRLVAECMLRYYYYLYEPKENDEGNGEVDPEFFIRKEYWSKISVDGSVGRPRLFSRDVVKKKKKIGFVKRIRQLQMNSDVHNGLSTF